MKRNIMAFTIWPFFCRHLKGLAGCLSTWTDLQIPLVGGADHGYSGGSLLGGFEEMALNSYRDKPVSTGIFEKTDALSG